MKLYIFMVAAALLGIIAWGATILLCSAGMIPAWMT
jgi:hypothetical protein